MPIAASRLEKLQVRKLLQLVRNKAYDKVAGLIENGVPNLVNFNSPDDGSTALILAAKSDDEQTLQLLLRLGASPDIVDFEGKTAVMHCAEDGNLNLFRQLLKAGANLGVVDLKGRTALFYCIQATDGHYNCLIDALDKSQHLVNKPDNTGETVLHFACKKAVDHEKFIMKLLNMGADPNSKAKNGKTPLIEICASGGVSTLLHAVNLGGNLYTVDCMGRTVVHEAALCGQLRVLVALSGFGVPFDVYDEELSNPIHLAAAKHEKCCQFLAQRGCRVKAKNKFGQTPRMIAVAQNQKSCLKVLRRLERTEAKTPKRAEPWALRLYDWCVTYTAVLRERFTQLGEYLAVEAAKTIKMLAEEAKKGAELEEESQSVIKLSGPQNDNKSVGRNRRTRSKSGRSVRNSTSGVKPVVRIPAVEFESVLQSLSAPYDDTILLTLVSLHQRDADKCIDWREFLSGTKYVNKAYRMAVYEKGVKRPKARKGGKSKTGRLPMDICILPKEAIYRRADGGPPVMFIPKKIQQTDFNRFSAEHPPVHPLQDDSSWYLERPARQYISFHAAAKHNDIDSIRLAISEGYDVDTRNMFYKTPLMTAAHNGSLEAAIALINMGANVNAKDNFFWTPLHHAAHSGMIDMVELLLRNGAELDSIALNGGTPLVRAIECSRLNVVDYVLAQRPKLGSETRKGTNIYQAALAWADPRVIEHVREKWELAQEKLKLQKKSAKTRGKQSFAIRSNEKSKPLATVWPVPAVAIHRSRSLRRVSSKGSANIGSRDATAEPMKSPTYSKFPWLTMPTRAEQLGKMSEARERYEWDHGLPGVSPHPFDKRLSERLKEAQAAE